jgi:lysine 2,3-aminomutase
MPRTAEIQINPIDWTDWKWQLKHLITSPEELSAWVNLDSPDMGAIRRVIARFPMGVTPYFARLLRIDDGSGALRTQVVPSLRESVVDPADRVDPLGEEKYRAAPGVIHKYPDRVLLLLTESCAGYCRFCTRKRLTGKTKGALRSDQLDQAAHYIRSRREIRDVILSGGDPLILPTTYLRKVLSRLRAIGHVEIIRIHTRVPVFLPMRIDDALISTLKAFHPLYVAIHFNHPRELTDDAVRACEQLADSGIPVESQTVLLKGINDDAKTLKKLFQELLKRRVRPYYLHQCDLVVGASHFRTSIQTGLDIMKSLQGNTSGLAIPRYAVDAPGGGGKITLSPNFLVEKKEDRWVFESFRGEIFEYPE